MKITWLLLSVCLAVAYSESQEEFDSNEDSYKENIDNVLEELLSDLRDDDFTEFETHEALESEIDHAEKIFNELFSNIQKFGLQDDAEVDAFENELSGLLSGLLSGTIG